MALRTDFSTPPNSTAPAAQLRYLKSFTQKDLEELCDENGMSFIKDLNKTPEQLEETLKKYRIRYYLYTIENYLANSTNLLLALFLIATSNEGIKNAANAFAPGVVVPDAIKDSIGTASAVLCTLLFILSFPVNEALKSTLKDAYGKSKIEKVRDIYHEVLMYDDTMLTLLKKSIHHTILLTSHLTIGVSRMTEIINYINELPIPANIFVILSIFYFSTKFSEKFSEKNYYQGVQFWQNKSLPSLYQKMKEGNFAVPLQILLQGASSVGMRVFLLSYLAEAAKDAFGFWLPTPMVIACEFIHSSCLFYPESYNFFLAQEEKTLQHIREKVLPLNLNLTLQKEKEKYYAEVIREYGRFYLFHNDPKMILRSVIGGGLGGWLGLQTSKLIHDNLMLNIFFTTFMALVFGIIFYRAAAQRTAFKLINEKLFAGERIEEEKSRCCEKVVEGSAYVINGANSIATAASNIGSVTRLTNKENSILTPQLKAFLQILSIIFSCERAFNTFLFTMPKVLDTLIRTVVPESCKRKPSYNRNRLFPERVMVEVVDEKKIDMLQTETTLLIPALKPPHLG